MSYQAQLKRVKEQKHLQDSIGSRWQGDQNSPYLAVEKAHRQIMSNYLDKEIERLTALAIREQIAEQLKNIAYNVTLNGEKITDAIVQQFTKGFPSR